MAEKWLDAIFGETKEEFDLYYVSTNVRSGPRRCQSKICDMLNQCKSILHPRKFDIILAENCSIRGKTSIYDSNLTRALNQLLKVGGLYVSDGEKSKDVSIDDIQDPDTKLSKWLGSNYKIDDYGIQVSNAPNTSLIVFRKIR
jgi:hypothetical protein